MCQSTDERIQHKAAIMSPICSDKLKKKYDTKTLKWKRPNR
jgi:hypothetical protein